MKTRIRNLYFAATLLAGVHQAAAQGTVFPIATNGAASQAGIFAAFGGTNYLVGIQGDGTTNYTAISAQLVSTNGTLVGSRILTGRTGGIPYVASGGTNYLLVWSDNALVASGGNDQLYGQFVSRSGALVGSPFTFGPTNEEQDMQGGGGSLLAFDGHNYLAVWDTGAFHDAPSGNVHGAMFSQTGSLIVPIIDVTSGINTEVTPEVVFGKTNYLVAWNDLNSGDIYGEFISTNGTQGSPFAISQTTTPSYNPLCAAFDGTNFFVVWNKNIGGISPNTIWNIYGRLVSPTGSFPGNEVPMVTDTNNPVYPSLASDGADYLLAWNEGATSTNSQIEFQFFNPAVIPVGSDFNLFSQQGTNAPLLAGVLFDGTRFEITSIVGGATGLGATGLDFTSGTGTWGAFQTTAAPVAVATTSLPNGTNGVSYNQTLAASGGQPPYSWTNSSGALPAGLTLATNGVISGTPTTNGTFIFTVKVTDALSETATHPLTLTVGSLPSVTTTPTNNSVSVMIGSNVTFFASVSGTGPFSYQWQLNGSNLPNGIITTVAGNGRDGYSGDGGTATNAELNGPEGVTVDASGNLFIADTYSQRVRKVGINGIITTVAGNGTNGYSGDGGAATNAEVNYPNGLALDVSGNLFIADTYNQRVREVGINGIITTVAGNGTNNYYGDGDAATNAELYRPEGVALDAKQNLFIADTWNNVIRRVGTNGIITTVAGNGIQGHSGDGGAATNAEFSIPGGVMVDANGNLFITDSGSQRIRKVGTNGIITNVAGNGYYSDQSEGGGFSGDGGAATSAEFNWPYGVALDSFGNLYIADSENNRIRQVGTNGIISTVAGSGPVGYGAGAYSGDGGAATNAELNAPYGVAVDASGNLFIADTANSVIRKIVTPGIQGPTLTLNNVGLGNAGAYDVVVSSPYGSVTSSVVNLTLTLPDFILSAPQISAGNTNLTFLLTGPAGSNYVLQVSTNLLNWSPLSTSTIPVSGSITLSNAIGGSSRRFYRAYLP